MCLPNTKKPMCLPNAKKPMCLPIINKVRERHPDYAKAEKGTIKIT